MKTKFKETYEAPAIIFVDVRPEGFICLSGGINDPNDYSDGGEMDI